MGLVGYSGRTGSGFSPYNPSKGGVLLLTKNLAVDLAPKGVRVNCINPGFVETPFTVALTSDPEQNAALIDLHPIGRLGQPEEIANCALFLASDESSFVTGSPLIVDGGYTAQ
jgi:NAD(P)-dependent dehydrogenase (short-subunit alcohol dehydrogenase family)